MAVVSSSVEQATFRRTLNQALLFPLLAIALLVVVFLLQLSALLYTTNWVDHTNQVLASVYTAQNGLLDMETGLRGYLLTGSDVFLEPYTRAYAATGPTFDTLTALVSDNPQQTQRIVALRARVEDWRSFARSVLELKSSGGAVQDVALQTQGKQIFDDVRAQLATFINTESRLRDERSQSARDTTQAVILATIVGAVIFGLILALFIRRQLVTLSTRFAASLDVAQRQTEATRQQREWLQGTLASIGDAVIATDALGNIAFMNEIAHTLTGWPAEGIVGKPLGSVFTVMNELTEQTVESPVAQTLLDAQVSRITTSGLLVSRTGEKIAIEGSAALVRDAQNKPSGVVVVFRDVSDRKRTEERFRSSARRYRDLAASLPSIVWTAGPDGARDFFNQRWYEYTAMTYEQSNGWGWQAALHPDDQETFVAAYRESIHKGTPFEREGRLRGSDGAYLWHLSRALPSQDDSGRVETWVGTSTNIDRQKNTELVLEERTAELEQLASRLEERNLELDQFAYVTSHDLKAPLRGIANLSQWIEEDLGESANEEIHKQMELLRGRVHRMEGLIDGILEYSRVGRVKSAIESVDVQVLLTALIDLLSPPPGFNIEIGPGMPTLRTERLMLQQVFQNLIQNAIKHHTHKQDGHIWVTVQDSSRAFYEFSVRDDGPGIAPEYHQKIFVIFQTLESRDKVEGSGLGLALVKKMVEQEGGKIRVESQPGAGATFRFTWPKRPKGPSS